MVRVTEEGEEEQVVAEAVMGEGKEGVVKEKDCATFWICVCERESCRCMVRRS